MQDLIDRLRTYASTRKGELAELITEAADALDRQTCEDAVSRRAAIELAMQYCPDDDGTCSKADEDIRNLLDELEDLPSVQPEVVYCKKCKHWTRTCGDEQWGLGDCDVFDKHLVMCNGYCAWAERRTDGSD